MIDKDQNIRDGYLRFFARSKISTEDFFKFGLDEIIHTEFKLALPEWEKLKRKAFDNQTVFIRGFGRNAARSGMYQCLYSSLIGNQNVKPDPNNNYHPTNLIRDLTGYSKQQRKGFEEISNYQVSHIFGRTKNVFTFTAPWNSN